MARDDYVEQGKQMANDLRDSVSKKVSDNQDSIRGTLGKAARWVDEKTGGKYSEQITKAETKVGDGIGWVAAQGEQPGQTGTPESPGATAGDGTGGGTAAGPTPPTAPPNVPGSSTGPSGPTAPGAAPRGPGASAGEPGDPADGDLPPRPPQY